ncbi:hypothetical protein Sste5346_005326 [Sporothrix stenoceras]|uniref:C2H2-type domain-containing protein n=1 Tax=Sporothrix stenoceras TaxID=5173 RepID=A0ABR3Z4I8_9PEZI
MYRNRNKAKPKEKESLFQCYECPEGVQVFGTEEALITHKWDMIRATKRKSHMSCHVCKLDHRTFEGLVRHYQLNHPVKQQLECPGCQIEFTRLHSLMYHLDNDECPHVRAERVKESRGLQVQATNLFASAAAQAALEGGGGSVRDDGGFNVNAEPVPVAAIQGMTGIPGAPGVPGVPGVVSAAGGECVAVPPDAAISRQTQLGIFNHSGVTVGDFGSFINIHPNVAAAIAAESKLESVRTTTASGIRGNLVDREKNDGNAVPPTSMQASQALLIKRQRQMGVGGVVDPKYVSAANATSAKTKHDVKGKGKAVEDDDLSFGAGTNLLNHHQAARAFRQGDSKAPDLLTDDNLNTINQRFQGLNVWAGQAMLNPEAGMYGVGGGVSGGVRAPSGHATPAPPVGLPGMGARIAKLATNAGIHGLTGQSSPDEVAAAVAAWKASAMAGPGGLGGGEDGEDNYDANTIKIGTADNGIYRMDATPSTRMAITIHHPKHPNFSVGRYYNPISHRYNCPWTSCQKIGKVFKKPGQLIAHLSSETAHSKVRVQCPSCFDLFETVNALMQHCESQSNRCQFRESDDFIPFLNILSAGVAEIHGRNVDMTLQYNVQEGAAPMLLMDEQDSASQAFSYA